MNNSDDDAQRHEPVSVGLDPFDAAIAYATAEGSRAGRNAASWYFDGNTKDETYRAVLTGLDDGDPMVLDTLPFADLSGEWADTLTGPQLENDALDAAGIAHDDETSVLVAVDLFTDICDAYEIAFSDAAQFEIERVARKMTA